jgi:glycerate-2-kinase
VRPDGLAHLHRTDIVLVGADAACFGAVEAARRRGLAPLLLSTLFEEESSALGRFVGQIARQIVLNDNPVPPPCVLIAGGETTVSVHGASGRGGPNQEFAAGAALDLEGTQGIVVLSIDTDGTDGPTEYAGALIDGGTSATARSAGVDLYAALAAHDVTPALERTGNLVVTGATGTNVNDLRLVLVDPGARSADR